MPSCGEKSPFICSSKKIGMQHCYNVPPYSKQGKTCSMPAPRFGAAVPALTGSSHNNCVNWNLYYNVCRAGQLNPHMGSTNFDSIGYAWITIFQVRKSFLCAVNIRKRPQLVPKIVLCSLWQHRFCGFWHRLFYLSSLVLTRSSFKCFLKVILFLSLMSSLYSQVVSLEGWTETMVYVMDADSFWTLIFFLLITIVSTQVHNIYTRVILEWANIMYDMLLLNCKKCWDM